MRRRLRRSARIGVARSLAGAAFAVLVTASAARASPGSSLASNPPAVQDSAAGGTGQILVRRPFEHQRHDELPCRGCHGAGAAHRTTRVRAPADCAACHHDPGRGLSCARCHRADGIPAERTVRLSFTLQVADTARTRDVTFRHDVHVATGSGVACTECHGTAVTLARNRECGSCHASHHSDRTNCVNCHAPPKDGAHDASVHLTCAGSACHASSKAPAPTLSRATCLFCHADQRDHEPEGSCAGCHRIPGAQGRAGTGHALKARDGAPP